MRKALAWLIIGLGIGTAVEAQMPDPRLSRIPVDGGIVIGCAALMRWALSEIEGEAE